MVTPPRILLLGGESRELVPLAAAARAAGYMVFIGRSHEMGVDALERTHPDVVLLHSGHPAVDSLRFRRYAERQGARILLFGLGLVPDTGAVDLTFDDFAHLPLVQLNADGATLLASIEQALEARAVTASEEAALGA